MSKTQTRTHRAVLAIGAAALLLAMLVAVGLHAGDADAKAAQRLGATKKTPSPACPKSCFVAGSVTGFQTVADGKGTPFTVPSNGHIVAWSVSLGKPVAEDIANLNTYFPKNKFKGKTAARLSILKPKGKGKFKLTRQSPPIALESKLGTEPIFTLGKPLRVKKGQRVGLTTPTWGSYFQLGLPKGDNQWIASRNPNKCSDKYEKKAKPQQKVGSTRRYGCRFNGERLLYWAYFVPSGKKK